ncbi:hypothetical protein, variant [Sphaeroforma arctica JP610]|uniref:CNNM transmembrane domain-containing protein n=1 Tax=Sphaeroforma arctica JP610 TaxID=667725 RepID=A0A0L0FFL0_9EUKA|nr:hypothetical protein, variant [Sphaeroforma arctica JP610]KNC75256.1 hypothetical protein, variant [Sphaeroforma arctica JP610]|eukprot:XP_014149158.1 hypothetical protein, variant [Sphaeroforma arctica JP610]
MLIQDIEPGSLYLCVNNTFVATAANGYALIVEEEETPIAPLWAACLLIFGLLCLSGLFSGLNLGLMALDTTGLQIIMKVGEPQQKKYAETIYPIRKHGNLLLCTLLLGNVLVNNTLTIILESVIGGGVMAVILSTAGIVVFGEIIPQSICTRHGLFVGAKTIYITKLFVMLMFVIAYPISKILDWVLGRELGVMYSRRELKELVRLTGSQVNLNQDEMAMIGGVLDFTTKTVGQIMTPMQDVFMIEIHARLDFKTLKLIVESGHSRVPVYENDSYGIKKIVGILFVKDLTFVDPDDELPLSTVIKFYDRTFQYVFDDTKLDEMLSTFKSGHCHLAVVRKVNDEGEGDPFYENVGVISLEDVLEEIIQSEIVDETDRITDNITRNPVPRGDGNPLRLGHKDHASATNLSGGKVQGQTFDDLSGRGSDQQHVSSQLKLAILSFLTTSFDLFGESTMTRAIAQRVIDNAMYRKFNRLDGLADTARREGGPEAHDSQTIERARRGVLYESGKKTTVFTVILEGRVRVITNTDGLTFDAGPFSTLGIQTTTFHCLCLV